MTAPAQHEYWRDWYEVVTSPELRQGDVFRNLLAFWLPQHLPLLPPGSVADLETPVRVDVTRGDWIVLSASCDIVRGDRTHVLLARVAEANQINLGAEKPKALSDKLEVLRQGYDPARFLLAPCADSDPAFPISFVEYRQQVFLPLGYLRAHCDGSRIRLRPPFREKFGAWAGSNLGRVGVEDASQIPRQAGFSASNVLSTAEDPPYP